MAEGHLLEESVSGIAWMVLGSASGEPIVDEGLAPFSVFEPRLDELPHLGVVSIPPSPKGQGARLPSRVLPYHRGVHPPTWVHPLAEPLASAPAWVLLG